MNLSQRIEEVLQLGNTLKGTNLRTASQLEVMTQMRQLLSDFKVLGIGRSADQIWYRCRTCSNEEGFGNVLDLIYPKSGSSAFGRASLPGQEVLYASWNVMTALEETSLAVGDTIQYIALRVRPGLDIPCAVVGEYQSVMNAGRSWVNSVKLVDAAMSELAQESGKLTLLIDSIIADQFRGRVNNSFEYKFTACFADHLLRSGGGLMYPSVAANHGINLAIPGGTFDSSFEVLCTDLLQIQKYYGHGVFDATRLKGTCEIQQDGTFVWNSNRRFQFEHSIASGMRVPREFKGWRLQQS